MSTISVQNIEGYNSVSLSQLGSVNAASFRANSKSFFGYELLAGPTYFPTPAATITVTNIPGGYHELVIMIGGLRHDAPNAAYQILETSNNNGSTWHTGPDRLGDSSANGNTQTNRMMMLNANGDLGSGCIVFGTYGSWYSRYGNSRNWQSPTNAIRLSMNAGTILANVAIYGLKAV